MDYASSETCTVFIKNYKTNEFQKHCVVHHSNNIICNKYT